MRKHYLFCLLAALALTGCLGNFTAGTDETKSESRCLFWPSVVDANQVNDENAHFMAAALQAELEAAARAEPNGSARK